MVNALTLRCVTGRSGSGQWHNGRHAAFTPRGSPMAKSSIPFIEPTAEGRLRRMDAVSGTSIGEYLIRRLQDYRRAARLRHSRRLRAVVLRDAGEEPAGAGRMHARRLRRFRRRRLRPAQRHRGGVRDLLRGRAERVQLDCRGAMPRSRRSWSSAARPACRERLDNPLLHHRVKDFRTQAEVFRRSAAPTAELNDPHTALAEIDRVLAAVVRFRRPGYIELPRDHGGGRSRGPARSHADESGQRSRVALRGGGRGVAADRRGPAADHPGRRRNPPLRPAVPTCWNSPRRPASPSPPRCWARA